MADDEKGGEGSDRGRGKGVDGGYMGGGVQKQGGGWRMADSKKQRTSAIHHPENRWISGSLQVNIILKICPPSAIWPFISLNWQKAERGPDGGNLPFAGRIRQSSIIATLLPKHTPQAKDLNCRVTVIILALPNYSLLVTPLPALPYPNSLYCTSTLTLTGHRVYCISAPQTPNPQPCWKTPTIPHHTVTPNPKPMTWAPGPCPHPPAILRGVKWCDAVFAHMAHLIHRMYINVRLDQQRLDHLRVAIHSRPHQGCVAALDVSGRVVRGRAGGGCQISKVGMMWMVWSEVGGWERRLEA